MLINFIVVEPIPDYDALNAKRQEIIVLAREALGSQSIDLTTRVVDAFCRLTPPENPPRFMTLVDGDGSDSGRTRKPGNIILNWRKLVRELPDIVLTFAGAANTPLMVIAAFSIWNKLWSHSSIEVTPETATGLVAMWEGRRGKDDRIDRTRAYDVTRKLFEKYKLQPLSTTAFEALLNKLHELQCIEFDGDQLWLREWVRFTYS